MSTSNKVVLAIGIILIVLLIGSLALAERSHCGGRGCVNQFPSPTAATR